MVLTSVLVLLVAAGFVLWSLARHRAAASWLESSFGLRLLEAMMIVLLLIIAASANLIDEFSNAGESSRLLWWIRVVAIIGVLPSMSTLIVIGAIRKKRKGKQELVPKANATREAGESSPLGDWFRRE